jgi:hypothetical protein
MSQMNVIRSWFANAAADINLKFELAATCQPAADAKVKIRQEKIIHCRQRPQTSPYLGSAPRPAYMIICETVVQTS